ncbi:hypothetical protein OIU76_007475 [Salix suchowensis]|uniref:Uncharacterized protein n=1 Tax=Salix koriyanagi TaxID=2511006 RepID=A0A9Q0TDP2_9ROSI|nr:hypothetical protein OIU76_007475 [Salix suchowensis]KAJ6709741.1 hypothetical protein OIU74_010782 [Salix koriyanagi]
MLISSFGGVRFATTAHDGILSRLERVSHCSSCTGQKSSSTSRTPFVAREMNHPHFLIGGLALPR